MQTRAVSISMRRWRARPRDSDCTRVAARGGLPTARSRILRGWATGRRADSGYGCRPRPRLFPLADWPGVVARRRRSTCAGYSGVSACGSPTRPTRRSGFDMATSLVWPPAGSTKASLLGYHQAKCAWLWSGPCSGGFRCRDGWCRRFSRIAAPSPRRRYRASPV